MIHNAPEVSLITSWYIPSAKEKREETTLLHSLYQTLMAGANIFDLYFLDHEDIPWYKQADSSTQDYPNDPQGFAGYLTAEQVERIAANLRHSTTDWYKGNLIGTRPRFGALATYFPHLGLPEEEDTKGKRLSAVSALRNTLYLAYLLGCRCVEIVGGAGVPQALSDAQPRGEDYRIKRRGMLAKSLVEIYDLSVADNPLRGIEEAAIPRIAVELEPGYSFLLNDLEEFRKLRNRLQEMAEEDPIARLAQEKTALNIDIAHAFLLGYTVEEIREKNLQKEIAHFHISDHVGHHRQGGLHASDLIPGSFHTEEQYRPWLKLALELSQQDSPVFSKIIAVEMEACKEVDEAMIAVNTTQRWLNQLASEGVATASPPVNPSLGPKGVLMVLDIAKSTSTILGVGAEHLITCVEDLCKEVLQEGGSVMSFTGDGLIALFNERHFSTRGEAIRAALLSATQVCHHFRVRYQTNCRVALHWGEVTIPSVGPLKDQVVGLDVVQCVRVCEWLGAEIEPAEKDDTDRRLIAATDKFVEEFRKCEGSIKGGWQWQLWKKEKQLRGIQKPVSLYLNIE